LESIRAFVAIGIPAAIQQRIAAIYAPLTALPDQISWVKPQNLHLTLRFLGEVDFEQLEGIKAALRYTAQSCQPFPVDFTEIGVFPNTRRPRVIWLGLEDSAGRLVKLQQELERSLELCGFAPEEREFRPHLTLGRVRRLRDRQRLVSTLRGLSLPQLAQLEVRHLSLMRSQLRPQGPVYTELESAPLGELLA
jgi:2'-5' RNA ligase